ncbi:hypothetical protein [Bacillus massilinigeriensis]|uniref:hypothetical protein n=1 Tax=Bacillus mediterraneensis TaxID=1805474 RepID=UPI0008F8D68C|nr:hypothetical protein [Bacillus mediterraneensis]
MSIRQYYLHCASSYLNSVILSLTIMAAILGFCLILSIRVPFGLAAGPYLFFSFWQFQGYLLNKSQIAFTSSENCSIDNKSDILDTEHLVVAFAPAQALKLLLFSPEGIMVGEIKESREKAWRWIFPDFMDKRLKKDFFLLDQQGVMNARITVWEKKAKVFDDKGNLIARYDGTLKRGLMLPEREIASLSSGSKMYTDLRLKKENGFVLSQYQTGWMKSGWNHLFRPNTPILSFDAGANRKNRLFMLAVLTVEYCYFNH